MKPANPQPPEADALARYRARRDAERTSEPFGGSGPRRPGLFVVHKHSATRLHYDLRLEHDGVLLSWAVPKGPSPDPDEKRFAVHVEDHPVEYADFEGVIPADNYGAGPSIVWDRGYWVNLPGEKHGLEHGKLLFDLYGHKLKGRWTLVRTRAPGAREWLLIKKPDAFARKGEAQKLPETSIYSGLEVHELPDLPARRESLRAELEARRLPRARVDPRTVELMLAETADAPFSRPGWLFELKYDGFRMVAAREDGKATLRYRRGNEVSRTFPELAVAVKALAYDCVLDGELVVLDERGLPSFGRLQQRTQLEREADIARMQVTHPATLFAFDLLSLEGYDLRGLPLRERKALLRRVLPEVGPIRYVEHFEERGREMYEEVRKLGLEGVMGKRADAPYKGGRRPDWLKVKGEYTGEFAVVGYTLPKGSRTGLGALDLAARDGERWIYVGSVGTGFTDRLLQGLRARLEPEAIPKPVFVGTPTPGRKHVWVNPSLVVEVAFGDWTADGMLRHPKLVRLREDKAPEECRLQDAPGHPDSREPPAVPEPAPAVAPAARADARTFTVTHPEKVFWPEDGYTKGDLVAYYRAISPWLLPWLKDRPLVLTRYPDGIRGKSFFQKDAPAFVPDWIRRQRIWSESVERDVDYFLCDDEESVAYLANLGTILLHVWASRVQTPQAPDWASIDLDPKGAPFAHVVQVARKIREICEAIDLPTVVKTSGSTGLHVLIPLGARCTHAEARGLAELISRVVASTLPDIATLERVIAERGGRVYLDYLQNGYGKVLVAPYSVRPLPGAPVSMPLSWREVTEKNGPKAFNIKNAVRRAEKWKADPLLAALGPAPDFGKVLARLGDELQRLMR
ncbi:MAG: DNA ligase D [Myxococcaceae bacterium]|nr:DNA ligase D [Myxococcaceae bacterium]